MLFMLFNIVANAVGSSGLSIVRSGPSGYTEEEKRVLEYTSKINENLFVPFMNVDLKDRFVFSIPFTDKVNSQFTKNYTK